MSGRIGSSLVVVGQWSCSFSASCSLCTTVRASNMRPWFMCSLSSEIKSSIGLAEEEVSLFGASAEVAGVGGGGTSPSALRGFLRLNDGNDFFRGVPG